MLGRVAVAFAVCVLVAACGTKTPATTPSTTDPFAGANCGAVKPPVEPELMAWDPAARAQLERLRHQGVVAVRYEAKGCDVSLELLPDCVGPKNKYVYSPMSSTDSRVAQNVNQLLDELPLGASSVSSLLVKSKTVRVDFKLVGAAALPVGTTISEYDLLGTDCKKATHVVSAVYVGGFGIAQEAPNAPTNAFTSTVDAITREGAPAICDRAANEGLELAGCSTPLRVALIPLNGQAPPPTCPGGWAFDGKRCVKEATSPICSTWGGAAPQAGCGAPDPDAGAGAGGVFDEAAVERVVRQKVPNTKRNCWEVAPSSLKNITVNVTLTVDTQGRVVGAEPQLVVAEGPADTATSVARCIANDVMKWEFPPPDAQQTIQLPFHLMRQ
jgi:hypothetical protein